jgi:flagellar protein FliS
MTISRRGRDPYRVVAENYRESEVLSATPTELTVLLYEQLLADLKAAAISLRSNQPEIARNKSQHASDVLLELLNSLNFDLGGEVSERLDAIYRYMLSTVSKAVRAQNPASLDHVSDLVDDLLDAWRTVRDRSKGMEMEVVGQ